MEPVINTFLKKSCIYTKYKYCNDIELKAGQLEKKYYLDLPFLPVKFCFVISSYNNEKNIHNNLTSIINQKYKNWRAIYINDNSNDKTDELFHEIVKKHDKNIQSKFTYIKNELTMRQAHNKYYAYQQIEDFEVACILDGDDWLYTDNALEMLSEYYSCPEKYKIITTNYYIFNDNKYIKNGETKYSDDDVNSTNIRYCDWRYRHLKTGYGILFKSIPINYFKIDNQWLDRCTDLAEMFGVSELAGSDILQLTDKHIYVYNKSNSLLYDTSWYSDKESEKRLNTHNHIKSMKKCKYEFPKTYIINMEHKVSERFRMIKIMNYIKNENYQFIKGENGDDSLYVDGLYKKYVRSYDKKIKNNSNKNIFTDDKYEEFRFHCSKRVIGLLASVFKVFNQFIDECSDCDSHMVLFEDDVYVLKHWNNNFYINNTTLKGKDLVYLGCHNPNINNPPLFHKSYNVFNNMNTYNNDTPLIYGTYSIIISKRLIELILKLRIEYCIEKNMSWDVFINHIREKYPQYSYYIYHKQLFIPDVEKDGIQKKRDMKFYQDRKMNVDLYYK
jgi:glycosyltransferase involved in cell wall biosynthesis